MYNGLLNFGKSADKFRHPRFDAYSAEQVIKQQIWAGSACIHCYTEV